MPNFNLQTDELISPTRAKALVPQLAEYARRSPDSDESDWWVHNIVKAYANGELIPSDQ